MSVKILRSWLSALSLSVVAFVGATDLHAKGVSRRAGATAAPVVTVINGTPLEVHVGDDNSFQIFNSDVPGSGQIYPSGATDTADMGWFVRTADALYAPNFHEHSSTATSDLGDYVAFTPSTLSGVGGSGSRADPFRVSVTSTLGPSGLAATQQVRYINGDNYFTKTLTLTNSGANQALKIFLGADIYLSNSDQGVPYLQAESTSPGGQTCPENPPLYSILLIPQTSPDAYSATAYDTIWDQIKDGQLDSVVGANCVDNGAALQWNRTLATGASVTIQTAVSFGEIPPIAQFNVVAVNPASGAAGTSVDVTISGVGFQAGTTFAFGAGAGVSNLAIVNSASATATLTIDPAATSGLRDVTSLQAPGGLTATLPDGFSVTGGTAPLFTVTAVNPPSGVVGSNVDMTISGSGFQIGDTTFNFGAGIAVTNLVIVDGDTATATLSIDAAAGLGARDVAGMIGFDIPVILANGFSVTGGGSTPPSNAVPTPTLGTGSLIAMMLAFGALAIAKFHGRRA